MSTDHGSHGAGDPAREDRRLRGVAVVFVLGLVVIGSLFGFILVPLAQGGDQPMDLWATMCRALGITPGGAAGDPPRPGTPSSPVAALPADAPVASRVAWTRETLRAVKAGSAQEGEQVARTFCVTCHLPDGTSPLPLTPRLAGQSVYSLYKQLHDYRSGARTHPTMTALVAVLSEEQMADVAAYYASLPNAGPDPATPEGIGGAIRELVLRGDSTRALPPCVACHALGTGGPLEQPTLNAQYQDYIALQLRNYATGARRNDLYGRMRSVSRVLTEEEMDALAAYYGRPR